ncbi:nitrous oxide reductase accessory protein NosL [Cytobacillus praedii]|uniref:nitrous oxide reductase accessory protein NosL n=1 Tax=Cytobacillus praedii TaxID=1742358 RepID=UPI000708A00C|nr:nitrous oxide reductase accessory protein NosL [Cytobacillus praedii]
MKKRYFSLLIISGIILFLAACGKEEVQPVAINEETDKCEVCNMAVVDNQFATQVVLENGKSMVFDDIGCMYEWFDSNKNEKIAGEFVRDYHNKAWISVNDATYIYNQSVKTPMAYNVISFKDKATAEDFLKENEDSTLMTADDLAEHEWKQNKDMMNMGDMENHSHGDAEDSESKDSH